MLIRTPYARTPSGPADRSAESCAAGGSANDASAALDPAALARLAELDPTGANGLIDRVLVAFRSSSQRLRPQAAAARANADRAAIRLVVHTLKSSSASIGAMQVSQLCARIETAIRLDVGDDIEADLDALDVALDRTLAAIAQRLKEQT